MLMVYLNSCQFGYPKIVNPSKWGAYGSITNCSTIAMGNKNTSMCYIFKRNKNPYYVLNG